MSYQPSTRQHIRILFPTVFLLLMVVLPLSAAEKVRVGVYMNKPLVSRDNTGAYQGITIEILKHIAIQEGWSLEFIEGSWSDCLNRLESGETDLQVAIALSDSRAKRFRFNETTLLSNWAEIYSGNSQEIDSLLDLNNKRIAVLTGDIHTKYLINLAEKFDLTLDLFHLDSYDEVLGAVADGSCDVGLVNRFFAMGNSHRYEVNKTPVVFNPIEVRYASSKVNDGHLLTAIDKHLIELKENRNSIYYHLLAQCVVNREQLPARATSTLALLFSFLVVASGFAFLFKSQVKRQTRELSIQNNILLTVKEQLEKEIASRVEYTRKLEESEKRYATIFADSQSILMLINPVDGQIVEANKAALSFYKYSEESLCTRTIYDLNVLPRDEVRVEMDRARGRNKNHFFFQHRLSSGEIRDVEVYSGRVSIEGKNLLLSNIIDITELKQLRGIIPICSSCKQIRDDKGYWNQLEKYIRDHSGAEFSHGICPDCINKLYPELNEQ